MAPKIKLFNNGFTLVELLVVMSIISTLSSTLLAALSSARDNARLSKAYQTMVSVNQEAFSCVSGGGTLTIPSYGSVGGTTICNGGSAVLPDITDTKFSYCGSGGVFPCDNNWATEGAQSGYVISAYSGVGFSSGKKLILCGFGVNVGSLNWFPGVPGGPFSFGNDIKCIKNW